MNDGDRPQLDYQPADDFRRESRPVALDKIREGVRDGYEEMTRGRFKSSIDHLVARLLLGLGMIAVVVLAWLCVLLLGFLTD